MTELVEKASLSRLSIYLLTLSTNVCVVANSGDTDQIAPSGAVLISVYTDC